MHLVLSTNNITKVFFIDFCWSISLSLTRQSVISLSQGVGPDGLDVSIYNITFYTLCCHGEQIQFRLASVS